AWAERWPLEPWRPGQSSRLARAPDIRQGLTELPAYVLFPIRGRLASTTPVHGADDVDLHPKPELQSQSALLREPRSWVAVAVTGARNRPPARLLDFEGPLFRSGTLGRHSLSGESDSCARSSPFSTSGVMRPRCGRGRCGSRNFSATGGRTGRGSTPTTGPSSRTNASPSSTCCTGRSHSSTIRGRTRWR